MKRRIRHARPTTPRDLGSTTMTVWRLVRKEIGHRRLNFVLAVAAVAVAVGVLTGHMILLQVHDLRTEATLTARQEAADQRLAVMEDDYRKYMKELGFNLLILPAEQDLTEFWTKGYGTHTMPERHVKKLADSGTNSMRHLLPLVQQRVLWPEQKRRVILIGTRGEVPLKHRRPKEPMLLAVPPGQAVVGYELAADLELKPGDTITLLGADFVIAECQPERGSAEDVTIWVDLAGAQKLLSMPGEINAIEALKCFCPGDGADVLRAEVAQILPQTKVVLRQNAVTVRAKARARARAEHEAALAGEQAQRGELRAGREALAAVVVPLVIVGAAVWVGLLALSNVRQRRGEIGIFCALGLGAGQIHAVFLVKAVLIGLVGALLGYVAAFTVSAIGARSGAEAGAQAGAELVIAPSELFDPIPFVAMVLATPVLAALATWVPATIAARMDPATVLARE